MTYTWMFSSLGTYPTAEGQTDVVYQVHWTLNGDDGSGHTGSVYGSVNCAYSAGDPFIPFADLTKADVEGWTTTALGGVRVGELKADIDAQIAQQVTPTTVSVRTMPWA